MKELIAKLSPRLPTCTLSLEQVEVYLSSLVESFHYLYNSFARPVKWKAQHMEVCSSLNQLFITFIRSLTCHQAFSSCLLQILADKFLSNENTRDQALTWLKEIFKLKLQGENQQELHEWVIQLAHFYRRFALNLTSKFNIVENFALESSMSFQTQKEHASKIAYTIVCALVKDFKILHKFQICISSEEIAVCNCLNYGLELLLKSF